MNPYVRLINGKKLYYLHPKPSDFDIEAIAKALSKLCRFSGNTRQFYSVAEHSCRVHDICPHECKREGLLHEAGSEPSMNDMPGPLKAIIPQYKEIEIRLEKAMARRFKLIFPFPAAVKIADLTMLATEQKWLIPGNDHKSLPYNPLAEFKPWSMEKSYREFMKRYRQLYS